MIRLDLVLCEIEDAEWAHTPDGNDGGTLVKEKGNSTKLTKLGLTLDVLLHLLITKIFK